MELSTGEVVQSWSSCNLLGAQNSAAVTEAAIEAVRGYGVGACGPAGFYGSMDVHLKLEKEIAAKLGVEEAIIYSQGFMAVASVIPAFSKRGDILVADSAVSFAIQTGLEISRSHVYFFEHNDMDDLERVLKQIDAECKAKKRPLSRRFIVVEGLSGKTGEKCLLPQLLEIKKRYKYRIIVDESLSFPCLGPNGGGISDYFGTSAREIDIIAGSFSNSIGSSGGFCAGSHHTVDHQRLSSQAYCFSAALPALLAVSASTVLAQVGPESKMISDMSKNIETFNDNFARRLPKKFVLIGDEDSPLRMLRLTLRHEDVEHEEGLLDEIVKEMRARGFLLTRSCHVVSREKFIPPPSIRVGISAGFTTEEVVAFCQSLLAVLSLPR